VCDVARARDRLCVIRSRLVLVAQRKGQQIEAARQEVEMYERQQSMHGRPGALAQPGQIEAVAAKGAGVLGKLASYAGLPLSAPLSVFW
jgi:hypothetical protein